MVEHLGLQLSHGFDDLILNDADSGEVGLRRNDSLLVFYPLSYSRFFSFLEKVPDLVCF
jgi:hypothetical protein